MRYKKTTPSSAYGKPKSRPAKKSAGKKKKKARRSTTSTTRTRTR
mgnify:CR=1 FL=1